MRLFNETRIAKVLDGFDPQNSESDRRIIYETLGMRLDRNEFRDDDSSDSQGEDQKHLWHPDYAWILARRNAEIGT